MMPQHMMGQQMMAPRQQQQQQVKMAVVVTVHKMMTCQQVQQQGMQRKWQQQQSQVPWRGLAQHQLGVYALQQPQMQLLMQQLQAHSGAATGKADGRQHHLQMQAVQGPP
jgi:hypothetical protein